MSSSVLQSTTINPRFVKAGLPRLFTQRTARQKGVLRMSFLHYTSEAEVDRLIKALDHRL